jgi:hypothetical protein|tara:strand:+ start:172 stop:546 length:375 start_codon:yes stop_codon:yes gene_type:complete
MNSFEHYQPISDALEMEFNQMQPNTVNHEENFVPFTRVRQNHRQHIQKLGSNSGSGRQCTYPWRDPEYQVGDSFFKACTKRDVDEGKGRPNVPPTLKGTGRVWRTTKAYNNMTKQYGYFCERIQ